jgi:predicted aspartyl protease
MVLQEFLLNQGYTKVKLHLTKTNHFEIIVKVNGKKGLFILDTGASNSLVDIDSVEQFNLTVKDSEVKVAGAGAINMDSKISKKNKIKIGKWNHKKVALVLFNMTHVNTALKNQNANPVNGIIGTDLLKKGKAIIDYDKKYLYLKL